MPEEAIDELRKAVALRPDFADLRVQLAQLLEQRGDRAAARAELQGALERSPDYAPAHVALGAALYADADVQGAIEAWQRAIELDPTHPTAAMYLRMARAQRRRTGG